MHKLSGVYRGQAWRSADREYRAAPQEAYLLSEMKTRQCGTRTVPVRSACAGRGALGKGEVFRPDNPLRTGTVRGPMQSDVPTRLNTDTKERQSRLSSFNSR
jgi:hypothetical protein